MAYPPIPYRASEPSQMETQLAVLATDPARAGAAMQLLPGAAAIRQDIGARANMEADRDAALAAITQQQNAQNQRNEARLKTYALTQPGMTAAAMQTPELADLFAGSSPNVTNLVNAGTEGAFRAQGAKTNLELQQGYDYGVKSGNVVPPDVVNSQLGYKTQTMLPESLRLQGMKDAAAAARQASAQAAEQVKGVTYSYTPDSTGKGRFGVQSIPFGMNPRDVERNVELLNAGKGYIEKGSDGTMRFVEGTPPPEQQAVVSNRRTHMPTGTVTVGAGAPTAQAGRALPFAKTEGGGPTPATTQAPPSGVVYTRDAPLPANADEVLRKFIASQPANKQQAYAAAAHNGTLKFGQDAQGQLYITLDGRAITKPLTPRAQQ